MLCDDLLFRGPKMINDPVEAEATWTVMLQIPDWPSGSAGAVFGGGGAKTFVQGFYRTPLAKLL
jgi:hypothetical protein